MTGSISDTLTLIVVSSGTLEVHAIEEVMDNAMKTTFHEMHEPQHALQNLADALPALGIVAAVLGVTLLEAFTLEIGFFLFFLPYTMFYNWAYDNLREKFLKRRQQRRALAG